MKKKLIFWLVALLLVVGIGQADWYYNPATGQIDYYEPVSGANFGDLANVTLTGAANGNILYYNGTRWVNLAIGAATEILSVSATGIPDWVAAGAPGAHAATHELLGADLVDHDNLTNFVAAEHLLVGAIDHDSLLNYVAGQHIALPNTIATVLSDWDADLDTYAAITPSANVQTLLQNATFAAFMADLSGTATAAFAWNSQNLTGIGTIGSGNITSTGTGEFQGASVTSGDADTAGSLIVSDGTTHTQTISSGALAANITFVLPTTDGDNLDFLQTNGAGTLAWVPGAGGDAFTLKVDAGATADYFGVAGGDGLFRFTANHFTMADGGNFVTLSLADHATARAALGLEIAVDVQGYNAVLAELTALADPGADEFPFWNDTTNNFEFSTVLFPTATGISVGAAGNAAKLELEDADADVLAIQVGVQAGNTTYTWPTAFGTTGFVLASTDAGTMSWSRRQTWDADLDTYAGITPSANVQTLLANATFALFLADLSGTAAAPFAWGGQNLTNVGSIAPTSIDCGGVITAASYIGIEDTNELRFYDNGNYVGFEPGALEANQIWVLPIADGANTQVMQTDGAGTLSWVANSSGTMASDALWAAQGDLAYGNADDVGVILSFNYEGDILRLNATVPYWDTPGIANTNPVVIDDDNVADDEYARFTASGLESRTPAEVMTTLPAATTGAPGKSELATTAEVSAGTDTTRAVTADGLAGSTIGRKTMILKVMAEDTVVTSGDGKMYFTVPIDLNVWDLTAIGAHVYTADTGADHIHIDIYNLTDTADMLSAAMQIEDGEKDTATSAVPGTINGATDDVATADEIRVDVTTYAGSSAKGLEIRLTFEKVT